MELGVLFYLAIIVFCGLAFGRLAKLCKLPNVTGYLIAGLILGPSVLGIIPEEAVTNFHLISDMALGFIAFSIGSEFKMSYFKHVGFTPIVIAIFEALLASVAVTLGMLALGNDLAFSLVIGSIAAATAPAATIMVVRQYKAKGPVTETLMSVVALDDAVALIAFGFAVTIAKSINGGVQENILLSILEPVWEIVQSLGIGAVLGALFVVPLRWFKKDSNRLCLIVGFVFIAIAVSNLLDISALLTCMALGGVMVNVCREGDAIMRITDFVTPPLFMMFFAVSGAELELSVIPTIGVVGICYVVMRVVGKMGGAWLGAKIMKAPRAVQKYLGPTLIPQAGVAIGLTLVAQSAVPEYAQVIRAVVLCATFIYEIIGPAVSKFTLQKAGEIVTAPKVKAKRAG